ncbi:uncharacterized protein LOC108904025 [Anoplophora glabripennis]|nr:uncharacterized protein LOC108904025 [Anoplophora glabripennis]
MLYLVIGLIALPFLLLILSWLRYYREWQHIMAIPGPKSHPVIGTMIDVLFSRDLFLSDRNRGKMFYPIYKHWTLNLYFVAIMSAEDIELVLNNTKHNEKNYIYGFLRSWLSTGLLTSSGKKWQRRRKILTPAFHFSILQEFIHIFNRETQNLVKLFEMECDRPYTDVLKPITEFALYSIGETSMGVNLGEGNTSYKKAIYDFGDIVIQRAIRPWFHNQLIYNMSNLGRKEETVVKELHDFSAKVIKDRKQLFSTSSQMSYSHRKRLAMLDLLLKAKNDGADIDDEGIREEVDTFIFAGHDTTSMAICFALMALANEEKIQEEIVEELNDILGDSDKAPTYNELMEMKFLERCIKECLRLYPSVPFIGRVAGEDIKTSNGYTIPKGCEVNIYIYELHRSTQYWEDPEKFDPDRFLPENVAARHPFAYLPFSAGSRNCIGQRYAILEIKAALCGILRKFKLIPVDTPQQIKYKIDLILRPTGQVRVKFMPRKCRQYKQRSNSNCVRLIRYLRYMYLSSTDQKGTTVTMLVFIILATGLPFLLLVCSWIKNYQYWKHIMEIPGPKSYPVIGTMLDIIFDTDNLFHSERMRTKTFYPIYKHWSFNIAFVNLICADDIELVLSNTKHNRKSRIYDFLQDWLGSGLLTSSGTTWQTRRKILTPAFHFSILQEFVNIFNRQTKELVKSFEKDCDKPYINVVKPVTNYTLCAIGETSLSVNLSEGHDSYKDAVHTFGSIATRRVIKPWFHNRLFFNLTPMALGHRRAVEVLHEFSTRIVQERKKLFLETADLSNTERKRLVMLDQLLKAKHDGADIDDDGIREEVDTFIFEGHDTAAMAISFTLMALANEEKIQEQILQEIEEVLGESDRLPTYEDLVEMKFMERCIKECLRLYPSVPLIARVAGEDIKTRSGYTIPKGCDINIYIYDLHRSPQYWENPDKFDPDRFLPENVSKRHPFAYLPFSAGFRNCIGQRYALLEIKALLCGILRKFKLKPIDTPQGMKYKSDLVLRPLDGIRVEFELRK